MAKRPDEHALSVTEEQLSPVVIIVTAIIILLFIFAFVFRLIGTII